MSTFRRLRTYLALIETTYLIHRLPAWSGNMVTRAKHRPKIHVADSGLAAHLVDQSADALARPGNPASGGLLETFVVNELLKIRDGGDQEAAIYHFRDRDQREIDVLMEARDGRVVGGGAVVRLARRRPAGSLPALRGLTLTQFARC
jgi:predicted AAA+ superfamily ATPase